jgi:pimeloyl-ACP methyl ester carboxylesterase
MLAYETSGEGHPLMLLHGTNSSRSIWRDLSLQLSTDRKVVSVDLPCHGASPPTCHTPPEWAQEVAQLLDQLGLPRVAVVGHSSGGWTALELAKLGRASAVLALTPAGLWRRHSPPVTDAILAVNWHLGRVLGKAVTTMPLRSRLGRRFGLHQISARPAEVPTGVAIEMVETMLSSTQFPEHFKQTRRLRFLDGALIDPEVPVHVVWGDQDRIARARASRHREQLPKHAKIETWPRCGHMVMWDCPLRLAELAQAL